MNNPETITKERLKPEIIELIKKDKTLKYRLCLRLDKSIDSINRYLKENSETLIQIDVLKFLANYWKTDINGLTEQYSN